MLKVKIVTPIGLYGTFEASKVHATTKLGECALLPNHMPLVAMLEISKLILTINDTDEIFAINWQGNKYGLNTDRSVGTFSDLLTRVKAESQALSEALGMYKLDTDLVVGRGASLDSLERYGIRRGNE